MTKPFASDEMSARLEVLLRRRKTPELVVSLQVADLVMNLMERSVHRDGVELEMKTTEFRLLEYMMRRVGQTVTRTMLFEEVWGYNFAPRSNLVDVHMGRLRRKLDRHGEEELLSNVRGIGFVLKSPS